MHPRTASLTVFLVDDSAPIRQRVVALLAAADLCVVGEAGTPQVAIDGILAAQPAVVVLDVHLEGGNGLQVLRSVRRSAPEVAFVVFSNNANPVYRQRFLAEGARAFLDKATEFDQLAGTVHAAALQATH